MPPTITAVRAAAINAPLGDPLRTSRHDYSTIPYVFVKVTLSDGSQGIGEARESVQITGETSPSILQAVEHRLAPSIIGLEAGDMETIHARMGDTLAGNSAAKSAIDIAVYDALGHASGLSVSVLLGGAPSAAIPSSKAISVGPTAEMVAQAVRNVEAGFRTLKIKTGVDGAAEREAIAAIRSSVGPDIHLKLDANQAWSLQEAARFLDDVAGHDIQMIEQPLPAWDYNGSAELRRRTAIPVMLDEGVHSPQDAMKAISAGACDYINIKLVKTGGLFPAMKLLAVAESAGIVCQIGSLDTPVGSAAAIHLVHARKVLRFAEINGPTRLLHNYADGFSLVDGCADVEAGPGLGVTADLQALGFADP